MESLEEYLVAQRGASPAAIEMEQVVKADSKAAATRKDL